MVNPESGDDQDLLDAIDRMKFNGEGGEESGSCGLFGNS
jgi:hypothetical protein